MKVRQPDAAHGVDMVLPALSKIIVMATATTADNERDFAHHTKHYTRTDRGLCSNDWRAMERQISEACSGKSGDFVQKLALDSQKMWLKGYGRPRASGKEARLNFVGGKSVRPANPKSLASFVARRRKAVQDSVSATNFQASKNQTTLMHSRV